MGQEPTPAPAGQEPSGEQPTPVNGQEPKTYAEDYVKELRRESAGYRKEASDLKQRLEALESRDLSEQQKLQQERDRLKAEVDPLRNENARLKVALDKKLPAELVDRLRGDSPEALAEDADKLLGMFAQQPQPAVPAVPGFDGGVQPLPAPPATPEEQHQQSLVALLTGRVPPHRT